MNDTVRKTELKRPDRPPISIIELARPIVVQYLFALEHYVRDLERRLAEPDHLVGDRILTGADPIKVACPVCMGHGRGAKVTEPDVTCGKCEGTGILTGADPAGDARLVAAIEGGEA